MLIWIIILLFVVGPILWYFANTSVDKSNFESSAYTETKNLLFYARSLTDYLCLLDENHFSYFDYNTTFYEELFFLYTIEAVKIIKNNKDNKLLDTIKDYMFKELEKSSYLDFSQKKNILIEVFEKRKAFYMPLVHQFNYKLNTSFYNKAFDYQSDILSNNYKNKAEAKENIKNILEETIPTFNKFYTDYIY